MVTKIVKVLRTIKNFWFRIPKKVRYATIRRVLTRLKVWLR